MVFENLEGTICFLLQNGALNQVLFAEVCKVDISEFHNNSGKEIYDLSVYLLRLEYLIADSTTFIMHTWFATDDKPSLCKLLKYPGKHRRINISEEISTNYKKFGTFLLKDDNGTIVSGIERAKMYNADEINGTILEKWIGGKGQQPITWDTLVKCLRDIDLAVLADEIKEVLQWWYHC